MRILNPKKEELDGINFFSEGVKKLEFILHVMCDTKF